MVGGDGPRDGPRRARSTTTPTTCPTPASACWWPCTSWSTSTTTPWRPRCRRGDGCCVPGGRALVATPDPAGPRTRDLRARGGSGTPIRRTSTSSRTRSGGSCWSTHGFAVLREASDGLWNVPYGRVFSPRDVGPGGPGVRAVRRRAAGAAAGVGGVVGVRGPAFREGLTRDDTSAPARRAAHHHPLGPQTSRPDPARTARARAGVPGGGAAGADGRQQAGLALAGGDRAVRCGAGSRSTTGARTTRTAARALRRSETLRGRRRGDGSAPARTTSRTTWPRFRCSCWACIEAAAELPAENQAGLWGSLLPAAWSYQLAARARGLGTAWTTLHLTYEREVGELLGIPAHVRQGVLLPTAYYTGETFRPAPREPLDTVLHLERW